MITVGICDDSQIELIMLQRFIVSFFDDKKLDYRLLTFSNGEELLDYYSDKRLDLLFLDIYMKNINGIETGRSIRTLDSKVEIIYCTASSSFALESYNLLAFGYLVKPFDPVKLKMLLERFVDNKPNFEHKHLVVKSNYNDRVINLDDIVHIESDDKVLMIYTIDKEIIKIYGKLNEIEEKLDSPDFLRCHQSYIINMKYIKSVNENDFITTIGTMIPIRKREIRKIKSTYINFKKHQ